MASFPVEPVPSPGFPTSRKEDAGEVAPESMPRKVNTKVK